MLIIGLYLRTGIESDYRLRLSAALPLSYQPSPPLRSVGFVNLRMKLLHSALKR